MYLSSSITSLLSPHPPLLLLIIILLSSPLLLFSKQLTAPSFPLAVRSPYLSTWLPGGNDGGVLANAWPQFWTGSELRWTGLIRVDGVTYVFMGNPSLSNVPAVQQTGTYYTVASTFFYSIAGPLNLTITFTSPIIPDDFVRQSLPFSYMEVSFVPMDGKSHQVEIYTDIDAGWAVPDSKQEATWELVNTQNKNLKLFSVSMNTPIEYGESQQMTEYGYIFYGTAQNSTTVQCGSASTVMNTFIGKGILSGDIQSPPALQSDSPVFALSSSFESVSDAQSALFAIGHVRNPLILFNNTIPRYPYYVKIFESPIGAFDFFLSDYTEECEASQVLGDKIAIDAKKVANPQYADFVTLSARQAFAGIEFTLADKNGKDNDVMVFLKEISSDGNVNTVDVIMPSLPIWLYTNPKIIMYLLLPLLRYQATVNYPNPWAMHDMGFSYPNATGHPNGKDEPMPIEESGNMLLMALTYTKATNDTESIIGTYYELMVKWADYLVNNTLIPGYQLATTDAAGPLANQTNLAIKGIIALQAMSEIASLTNHPQDSLYYERIAQSYVLSWVNMSTASDQVHIKLAYQWDVSWGIQFNLLMDKLLGLNLVPSHVYSLLDSWYLKVANEYGVQLDTRVDWGKTDWNMWCAATSSSPQTQEMIVDTTLAYLNAGYSNGPLPDRYNTTTGMPVGGIRARPTVGAHFSLLLNIN